MNVTNKSESDLVGTEKQLMAATTRTYLMKCDPASLLAMEELTAELKAFNESMKELKNESFAELVACELTNAIIKMGQHT